MNRRKFIAHLGAGAIMVAVCGRIVSGDGTELTVIAPMGKWTEAAARRIAGQVNGFEVVSASELAYAMKFYKEFRPRVVLLGALGGQTGLEAATAYSEICRSTGLAPTTIILMPGHWEGQRRLDRADAALKVLSSAGVFPQIVDVEVDGDRTLQEWGAIRRQALENRLTQSLRG